MKHFPSVWVGGSAGVITIAQQLDTATQPDMPQSAIASAGVDCVLSPEVVGRKILEIARTQLREHE